MAEPQRERERQPPPKVQVHRAYDPMAKPGLPPSISRILAVIALLPVGFTLLTLAGITLTGTIIGLCVATPLFVIFSPVLVPAAIIIGLAMTGFLTSGAFGLTALSSFSWVLNSFGQATGSDVAEQAKRRAADVAVFFGQKINEVGHDIKSKAYEVRRTDTGGVKAEAGGKTERT